MIAEKNFNNPFHQSSASSNRKFILFLGNLFILDFR